MDHFLCFSRTIMSWKPSTHQEGRIFSGNGSAPTWPWCLLVQRWEPCPFVWDQVPYKLQGLENE